jgi:hypothetical protein
MSRNEIRILFGVIRGAFAILLVFGSAYAQTTLTPQESRGKQIYLLGSSKSGKIFSLTSVTHRSRCPALQ